jgi:murein DD-endopeptidase MepM/ murein hydrolase activator NlpD
MEKDVVLYAPSNQSAMASLAADSAKHPAEGADTRPEPLVKDVVPPPVPQVKPKLKPPEFKDGPARPVAGRFIWPVHGSITSNFGGKAGDMRNDGLNIAAPFGTPVAASDGGTVAYAGSEIPGYGNVVLIRHPDGYMTTYAHLERIMVDRDSIAAKGDIIGTVGTTGGLASPQLHFEIRKGAEALDPKKFMLNQ